MCDRSQNLTNLRPTITSALVYENMSEAERFQNLTLRPVILFQKDLLVAAFKNYIAKHKNVFYDLTLAKQLDYIENAIHKDMKFRNSLKGIIIGQFTIEEYDIYIKDSSALNKRMMNLVKDRLIDHIQLLAFKVA